MQMNTYCQTHLLGTTFHKASYKYRSHVLGAKRNCESCFTEIRISVHRHFSTLQIHSRKGDECNMEIDAGKSNKGVMISPEITSLNFFRLLITNDIRYK